MIQRVQTIFLFLAAVCGFGALAFPFVTVQGTNTTASTALSDGIFATSDHIGMQALFIVAGIIALVAIFMFQKRPLQLTTTRVAMLTMTLAIALTGFLYWQESAKAGAMNLGFKLGCFLPVLYLMFAYLATNGIRRDEALVRSSERLR